MALREVPASAPPAFDEALAALRAQVLRREVTLADAPAPRTLAPHALTFVADVTVDDEELASGRFVLLHDPAGHEGWEGTFRVVTLTRAAMDPEMAADPLLAQVAWAWLEEALAVAGVDVVALGGTTTRVVSEAFGELADRPPTVELELRASWTPAPGTAAGDLGTHLRAWTDLLCHAGGLPPLPEGVSALPGRLF